MSTAILTPARAAYYDRNAVASGNQYSGTLGNHAATVQFTTTVAVGTKILIEVGETFILTATAATTPLRQWARLRAITGGTAQTLTVSDITQSASLTTVTTSVVPLAVTCYAGDQITGTTQNDSASGTTTFLVSFRGTQYTA